MNDQVRETINLLLTTSQFLESKNVADALQSPEHLAIAKGVIARLVILASNSNKDENNEENSSK